MALTAISTHLLQYIQDTPPEFVVVVRQDCYRAYWRYTVERSYTGIATPIRLELQGWGYGLSGLFTLDWCETNATISIADRDVLRFDSRENLKYGDANFWCPPA